MPTVTVMVSDCGQYCAAGEWWRLGVEPRHASCPHDNLHLTGKNDLEGLREKGGERLVPPAWCRVKRGKGGVEGAKRPVNPG